MKPNQYAGRQMMQGLKLDIFSQEGIEAIDRATLDVLGNYGIQVSDEEGLQLFEKAGCEVDKKTKMVKIPAGLVRKALASAPKTFYLYGREENRTIEQEHNGRVYYTCFGTGIQV